MVFCWSWICCSQKNSTSDILLKRDLLIIQILGLSHEFTIAYKIKGYGDYEDTKPIVKATKKTNPGVKATAVKKKSLAELQKEREAALALKAQQDKERLEK